MMTVGELVELLKTKDQSLPVVLSSDSEGNSYRYLDCTDDNFSFCANPGEYQLETFGEDEEEWLRADKQDGEYEVDKMTKVFILA